MTFYSWQVNNQAWCLQNANKQILANKLDNFSSRFLSSSGTIVQSPWGTARTCFGPRRRFQILRWTLAATQSCPAVTKRSTQRHLRHRVWHIGAHEGTSQSILSWTYRTIHQVKNHFRIDQFLEIYIIIKFCIEIHAFEIASQFYFLFSGNWRASCWDDLPFSPMSMSGLLNFSFVQRRAL